MTVTINGSGTITGVSTMGTTVVNQTLTTPTITSTMGVGNATPSSSGAGITFPATQSASTDANTLDDYEEGTFDVAVAFGGASVGITYNNKTFSYTKIGNMVHVRGYLYLSNKGSSTGSAAITGLPFPVKNSTPNYVPPTLWFTSLSYSGTPTSYAGPAQTQIIIGNTSAAGTFSLMTNANFTNTTEMMISFSYATD